MAADVPDGAAAYRENHLYAVDEALFRLWPVTDIFAGAGKPERGIFCTAGRMGGNDKTRIQPHRSHRLRFLNHFLYSMGDMPVTALKARRNAPSSL